MDLRLKLVDRLDTTRYYDMESYFVDGVLIMTQFDDIVGNYDFNETFRKISENTKMHGSLDAGTYTLYHHLSPD